MNCRVKGRKAPRWRGFSYSVMCGLRLFACAAFAWSGELAAVEHLVANPDVAEGAVVGEVAALDGRLAPVIDIYVVLPFAGERHAKTVAGTVEAYVLEIDGAVPIGFDTGGLIIAATGDDGMVDVVAALDGLVALADDTFPCAGFVNDAADNDGVVGSAIDLEHAFFRNLERCLLGHKEGDAGVNYHLCTNINPSVEEVGNAMVGKGGIVIGDIAIVPDVVLAIVFEHIARANMVEHQNVVDYNGALGAIADGVVLESIEIRFVIPGTNAVAQAAVDGAVFHRYFGTIFEEDDAVVFVGAAIDEINIFHLVVGAARSVFDISPRAYIVVVDGALEADVLLGGAHHLEAGILAHNNMTVNTGEGNGYARLDGEAGVAIDVEGAIDHIVDGQAFVDKGAVLVHGAVEGLGLAGAFAATFATAVTGLVAKGSDEGHVALDFDDAGVLVVAVAPVVEIVALSGGGHDGHLGASSVGAAACYGAVGGIVGLKGNGVLLVAGGEHKGAQEGD